MFKKLCNFYNLLKTLIKVPILCKTVQKFEFHIEQSHCYTKLTELPQFYPETSLNCIRISTTVLILYKSVQKT